MLDATAATATATATTANVLSEWAGDILKRSESDVFLACKQGAALLETAWNQADSYEQSQLRPAISAFQSALEKLQRQLEKAGI
jgi:hypothetical protein